MNDAFASLRDGTTPECLSDLTLDRLRNNEVPPDERARSELHLQSCVRCQGKRQALEGTALEEAEFPLLAARTRRAAGVRTGVDEGTVVDAAPAIREQASNVVRIGTRLAPFAIAAGLAAVVAAFFWKPAESSTQVKGGDSLTLVVKRRDGHIERVTEGATLFVNDQVRFSLDLKAAAFVTVLSLDAAGQVSVFTPEPKALPKGAEQLLDTTVELDASTGAERFVAVLCEEPKRSSELVTAAEQALRQANDKPERVHGINSGCREASVLVHKQ
jgi:hypothetical protein